MPGLLMAASSTAMLSFHTRPLSNAFESILLVVGVACLVLFMKKQSQLHAFLFGVCIGVGAFTRITFLAFAFPFGCLFLWSLRHRDLVSQLASCASLAWGIIHSCVLIILVDSLYFNSISVWELLASDQPLQLLLSMKVHITPWNHMRYNMDHDNLADHGLHPHYLHALVNAPLLFGPLYLLSLYTMARDVLNKRHLTPLRMACLASFLMGLVALSLFPHQEARFLLPLLGVMLLWLQLHLEGLSRRFYWWWIVFNLLTMLHFGVLHQAGVVPSLLWLSNHIKEPSQVHYWKTFMPPRHLLFAANGTSMSIVDHAGKSMEAMDILTACSPSHALYLVTPHVVQHTAFSQVHTVWPHVGFVDPLELLQHPIQSTSLYIYHIHCP